MKLVTFVHNNRSRLGALCVRDGRQIIVDLQKAEPRLPADMLSFLRQGEEAQRIAAAAVTRVTDGIALEEVKLKAPIPNPGKIICIGLNYRDHAAETGQPIPEYPTVFSKYANTVIGPDEPIVLPRVSQRVDYEGELGVVIGRRGRYISEDRALDYVAGYLPCNDVSARDFQKRTSQWTIGKTFDTFAPMGPTLVTADEIPDPHALDIRVYVSGELMQSSNTQNLIFSIPYLIAYLSQVMTLEPGDVILTGTPGGVGDVRTPPRYLQPGDEVQVEVTHLGVLRNPVISEAKQR